ncbi:MAG: YfhO family protein [Candidatus Wallbacteria bacterium]|nr:YfhO family protein [Candidatus Wallbacteria bacterium]
MFVAGLWLAALAYFGDVLFGGMTFFHLATPAVYFPYAGMTSDAMAHGTIRHWQPLIGLGYPFQADPHSMFFYPLAVIFLLLPLGRAYNVFTAIHVPLAGTFMYGLLRRWGLSKPAAALGGLSLMFCGYTISTTCLPTLLRGTTWTPLALLAIDPFLMKGSRRGLLAAALVLAIEGSGTDLQYVLFTGLLLLALPWLRPGADRGRWFRYWCGTALAGATALLLLAYQYLPLAQVLSLSDRVGLLDWELTMWSSNLANFYNLLLPVPFPLASHPYYWANFAGGAIPFYPDLYWGLPLLALAFGSLGWAFAGGAATGEEATGRTTRGAAAWGALGLAGLAVLLSMGESTPVFRLVMRLLPPLKAFRFPGKYHLIAAVLVPVAAALGLEGLRSSHGTCLRSIRLALGAALGATVAMSLTLASTGLAIPRMFLIRSGGFYGNVDEILAGIRNGWLLGLAFAFGLLLAMTLTLELSARGKLRASAAVYLLAFLTVVDLASTTRQGLLAVPESVLLRPAYSLEIVEKTRTSTLPPRLFTTLPPEGLPLDSEHNLISFSLLCSEMSGDFRGVLQSVDSVGSTMSVRLQTHGTLVRALPENDAVTRARVLAALGVTHVLEFDSALGLKRVQIAGREVGRSGPVSVRLLDSVSPRAFIAARARALESGSRPPAAADAILSMRDLAFYEPHAGEATSPGEPVPVAVRGCEIVRYAPERVEIDFDLDGRGLLVLLDAYFPNWTATVDGKPRPIYKVAGAVRGVPVEGGEHRLIMTYEPRPFRVGVAISLLALAAVSVGLLRRRP